LITPFDLQISSGFGSYFVCPPANLKKSKVKKFRDWLFKELDVDGSHPDAGQGKHFQSD
jgi:hypothetical protein